MADAPAMRLVGAQTPRVQKGGVSNIIMPMTANIYGGFLINPVDPSGQTISPPEELYVSISGPAGLAESVTTTSLDPGQYFTIPGGVDVWVNALSDGHRFTALFGIPVEAPPPTPVVTAEGWPPTGPTGLIAVMYAYLYQEYSDDDDLQGFVTALNAMQQDYVDTFNGIQLPIYSNPVIAGKLADWAMEGIYGYKRPTLYSQRQKPIGPLNTYWPNFNVPLNMIERQPATDVHVATDDLYKRCLTWHFQKGDGKYFNIRWLKRRVWRFMIGANGTCPHIDNTDRVSVEFGENFNVTIRIVMRQAVVTGGAMPNRFGPNGVIDDRTRGPRPVPPNTLFWVEDQLPPLPMASQFQEAVQAGILELPFQFSWNVVIQ
jgi:hypothetical protein